ncbi:hypothetical protein [Butyrivibrio proteoclasticus]|nr:hypothetical protein [Butyrivibrio proteoclasticus]
MKNKKLEAFVVLVGGAAWVYVALTSGKPVFLCAAFPLLYLAYDLFMKSKNSKKTITTGKKGSDK